MYLFLDGSGPTHEVYGCSDILPGIDITAKFTNDVGIQVNSETNKGDKQYTDFKTEIYNTVTTLLEITS